MRKRIFENIRFPFGFWFEDTITCLLVIRLTNTIVHLNKIVYHKTTHATNASKTLWQNSNIKSVDQYWLVRSVCDYASYSLHMPMDVFTYELVLRELGAMLVSRTKGLSPKIKYAVFKLCSEYVRTLNMESYKPLLIRQQIIHKALWNGNYTKWFLGSISAKFHKK